MQDPVKYTPRGQFIFFPFSDLKFVLSAAEAISDCYPSAPWPAGNSSAVRAHHQEVY